MIGGKQRKNDYVVAAGVAGTEENHHLHTACDGRTVLLKERRMLEYDHWPTLQPRVHVKSLNSELSPLLSGLQHG